jgi:NAD/NADP transhydrogenase alpha subunit
MIIGVVLDARRGETRVAATPTTVAKLIKLGSTSSSTRRPGGSRTFSEPSNRGL